MEQTPSADARFDALAALIERLLMAPAGRARGGAGNEARFRPDERLVVFTEYKTTLDYLARRLRERYPADRVLTLFGSGGPDGMDQADREHVKAEFNDPASPVRVLVATDAASEGLNLHRTARCLLHYDCPWNPSRLEQRNGRIDRYGQARDVTVHHFASTADPDLDFLAHVIRKADESASAFSTTCCRSASPSSARPGVPGRVGSPPAGTVTLSGPMPGAKSNGTGRKSRPRDPSRLGPPAPRRAAVGGGDGPCPRRTSACRRNGSPRPGRVVSPSCFRRAGSGSCSSSGTRADQERRLGRGTNADGSPGDGRVEAMSHSELLKRITVRPDVFGGKPIVRDMRLSVELILSLLAQGATPEEILDDYPRLEADDIRACVAYAHADDTLAAVSVDSLSR